MKKAAGLSVSAIGFAILVIAGTWSDRVSGISHNKTRNPV